jgi:O-antigen/teichoic acid export membrane protein
MRTKKSIKNIVYNLTFTLITILLGFYSRAIFLKVFDADYLGITTTVSNIIGVLSLMELGVASAIGYSLYKYLNEKDYQKINELMKFIKITYMYIGLAILFLGTAGAFFIDNLIHTELDNSVIYMAYFFYLLSSVLSYFITYKQILATSDQSGYIITKVTGTIKIIKTIVQIMLILHYQNFMLWVILETVTNVLIYMIVNRKISNKYAWMNTGVAKSYKELIRENAAVITNMKNIFFHRFTAVILYQTDSILISALATASDVAVYANYMLIVSQLLLVLAQVFNSFTASIGNLIAEKNDEKSYYIFRQLFYFEFFIAACSAFILYKTVNPFISVWIGSEFLLSHFFVAVIVLNFFISSTRQTIISFKVGYGIFSDIYAPVVEGIINISFSIFLGLKFGSLGVVLGTLISCVCVVLTWHPYILFKRGFKLHTARYVSEYIKLISISAISMIASHFAISFFEMKVTNLFSFFIYLLLVSVIMGLVCFGLFLLTKPFREVLSRIFININKKFLLKGKSVS